MILYKDLTKDEEFPKSCVYWIYNTEVHTDPRKHGYVGVSRSGSEQRFKRHLNAAINQSELPVHRAMRKYGDKIGVKVILEADPEMCLLVENMLRPVPNMKGTWNVAIGGVPSPTTGTQLSEVTRKKISNANSGEGAPFLGMTHTEEHKVYISERMSGDKNPMYGAKLSEEQKDYLSSVSKLNCTKTKLKDNYKDLLKKEKSSYAGWRAGNSNKVLWSEAIEIYRVFSSKESCGVGRLSSLLDKKYSVGQLATISRAFCSGWVPSQDSDYLEWLTSYHTKGAS